MLIGSGITVWLTKRQEIRTRKEKRLESINDLMKLTDKIILEGTEVKRKLNKLNPKDMDRTRLFFNEKLYDYIRESVFLAIHIDGDVYNKTVNLIDIISEQLSKLAKTAHDSEEFLLRIRRDLDLILKESQELMNLCDEKRNDYLIEYGNKYTIK